MRFSKWYGTAYGTYTTYVFVYHNLQYNCTTSTSYFPTNYSTILVVNKLRAKSLLVNAFSVIFLTLLMCESCLKNDKYKKFDVRVVLGSDKYKKQFKK